MTELIQHIEDLIAQKATTAASQAQAGHLFMMAERLRQLAHAHPAPVQAHQQRTTAITFCATSFCTNRTEGAVGRDGQPICESCRETMEGRR